jgi:hypothetical protein
MLKGVGGRESGHREKNVKYNLKEFNADFPDDAACLDFVFRTRYPDGGKCECGKSACFHRLAGRRAYSCAWCGFQLYPTAGTIFGLMAARVGEPLSEVTGKI